MGGSDTGTVTETPENDSPEADQTRTILVRNLSDRRSPFTS